MSFPLPALLLSGLAALTVAAPALATSPVPPPMIVGGWSAAAVTPEVRRAAEFGLPLLHRRGARIRSIDAAETQVVAGINYRITMTLTDRSRWHVTVWQRLDRSYSLTASERLRRRRV